MTDTIEIIVPHGHTQDPTCPHCFDPLGDHLTSLYPTCDPHELGGERECPSCDGVIHVIVDRPSPTFAVEAPSWYGASVRHIRSAGR